MTDSNKKVEYEITADATGFVKSMEQTQAAVVGATAQIDAQFKKIGDTFNQLNKFMLGFTAVLAGGGALKKFIEDANAWNSEAAKMAKQLGLTTEKASVLNVALNHIGVDSATYISASEKLSKNVQGNAQAFQVLGVKVQEASGQYRPVTQVMAEVNEKLAALKNPIEQNIAGQQVYGRGWGEVRAILKLTTSTMDDADRRARELGLIVGPEGAAMSRKYTEQMRDLNLVGKAMEVQFGNALLPVFTRIGAAMSQELPQHANKFASALGTVMETLTVLAANLEFVFSGIVREIGAIAAQMVALAHLDFAGFTAISDAVTADGVRARKELDDLERKIMGLGGSGGAEAWGREGRSKPEAAQPHYPFKQKAEKDGGEDSQMSKWQAKLAEKKAFIQEQSAMEGNFHQMSREEERKYWQDILGTIDRNSRDGLSVRKKIAEETQAIRKGEYEVYIETLKNERDELQKNYAQRTDVAVKAYQRTASLFGEESKEAKKAYGDVLAEHRKFVEQQQALDAIASDKRRNKQAADVELDRVQMQQELASGIIGNQEALAREMQFEDRLSSIRRAALEERKAFLIGTENDPVAVAQLQEQIEQLEQQHQQRLAQIRGQSLTESQRDVTGTMSAIQSSWSGLLSQLMKGIITIGGFVKGVFQSVANAVIDTLAQLAAKYVVDLILKRVLSKGASAAQIADNAAVAGAAATASAAAIPFIGWAMAPEAGAAAYGSALAYMAGLSSAEGGYDIPASVNPIVQTHAREMILPAKHADVIRSMADNGGAVQQDRSPVVLPPSMGPGEFYIATRKDLVAALKGARRDFAF